MALNNNQILDAIYEGKVVEVIFKYTEKDREHARATATMAAVEVATNTKYDEIPFFSNNPYIVANSQAQKSYYYKHPWDDGVEIGDEVLVRVQNNSGCELKGVLVIGIHNEEVLDVDNDDISYKYSCGRFDPANEVKALQYTEELRSKFTKLRKLSARQQVLMQIGLNPEDLPKLK